MVLFVVLLEAQKVKEVCGQDFITVTPGIRPTSTQANDQVRITTPQMAKKWAVILLL